MRWGKAVGLPINLLPPLLRMSKACAGFDAALAASVSRIVKPAAVSHVTFSEELSDPWQGCLPSLIRLEHVGSAKKLSFHCFFRIGPQAAYNKSGNSTELISGEAAYVSAKIRSQASNVKSRQPNKCQP